MDASRRCQPGTPCSPHHVALLPVPCLRLGEPPTPDCGRDGGACHRPRLRRLPSLQGAPRRVPAIRLPVGTVHPVWALEDCGCDFIPLDETMTEG